MKLSHTIGYLTLLCNLSSCIIISLTLRLIYKSIRSVNFGRDTLHEKQRFDSAITMSHIILILAYTFVCILHFNFPDMGLYITYLRTGTAWTFISGACDLFLTCMIWFVLDDEQTPSIMIHGEISYAIINIT